MDARLKHRLGAIDLGAVLGVNNHSTKLDAKIYDVKLDAKIYGAKLGARIYGAKLPANSSPRLRRVQDLGAKIYGAEMCKLGVTNDGAELRVKILKAYLQRHIYEKISKNG